MRKLRRGIVTSGMSVLLSAGYAVASPGERSLDLQWLAPESCGSEAAVVHRVEQYLGYPIDSLREPLRAHASVSRSSGGAVRVELQTSFQGEARERVLVGDSCAAVSDAVALVLAFLADPDAAAVNAEPTSGTPPGEANPAGEVPVAAQPATNPDSLAPAADADTPTPISRRNEPAFDARAADRGLGTASGRVERAVRPWLARAVVGADAGSLPAATSFLGLALGRAFGHFRFELAGAHLSPRDRLRADSAGTRGGSFELWALSVTAAYRIPIGRLELSPFLGPELGTVFGSGFGVDDPKLGKGLWLAATAGMLARYRVTPWLGAGAQAGLALPLARPVYVLDNVGSVYQADIIAFRGSIGLEAYF